MKIVEISCRSISTEPIKTFYTYNSSSVCLMINKKSNVNPITFISIYILRDIDTESSSECTANTCNVEERVF